MEPRQKSLGSGLKVEACTWGLFQRHFPHKELEHSPRPCGARASEVLGAPHQASACFQSWEQALQKGPSLRPPAVQVRCLSPRC